MNQKEIDKAMKEEKAIHICGFYREGEDLENVETPDGRIVSFDVEKCYKCKTKVKITKETRPKDSRFICPKCALEWLQNHEDEDSMFLINKKDEKLWEMAQDKMVERELKKLMSVGG